MASPIIIIFIALIVLLPLSSAYFECNFSSFYTNPIKLIINNYKINFMCVGVVLYNF